MIWIKIDPKHGKIDFKNQIMIYPRFKSSIKKNDAHFGIQLHKTRQYTDFCLKKSKSEFETVYTYADPTT